MKTEKLLSEEQVAILNEFESGSGHFVIEARAGTGKTFIIERGIPKAPETKKCYATFNKRNVLEAKARIQHSDVQILSLNSLGYKYVLRNWNGVKPDDLVEEDRIKAVAGNIPPGCIGVVKQIVAFAKNTRPFATLEDLVAIAESRGFEPEGYYEEQGWDTVACCRAALAAMTAAKRRDSQNRISFNDQLWLPVVMNWVRPWFDLLVVDEAQDMNAVQLIMVQKAVKKPGRLVLVGDPRQAIYGFRGADVNGMERLKVALNARVFPLTITFRCPKVVVEEAKRLVPDYRAAESAPAGEKRTVFVDKALEEVKVGDAIVSRKNAPLMELCLKLLKKDVPARIEGKDVGKTLLAIVRKLKAGSVPDFIKRVEAWAGKQVKRAEGRKDAEPLVDLVGDQRDTLMALAQDAGSVAEIENRITNLFSDSDDHPRPAVVLSSTHKAKGLEWPNVYILASTYTKGWHTLPTEETNLKYVAITRAQKTLTWVEGI